MAGLKLSKLANMPKVTDSVFYIIVLKSKIGYLADL